MGSVVVMIKTQIGLGVLSIPSAFDALGVIPGVLCMIGIGGTITWGNYVVGRFRLNHPEVYSIVDVGEMMGGKFGKEFMSVAFMLCKYLADVMNGEVLTIERVDLCGCGWLFEYLYRSQRPFPARSMYCCFRRRGRRDWLLDRLDSNSWKDLVARMGWCYIHHHRAAHFDHCRRPPGSSSSCAPRWSVRFGLQVDWEPHIHRGNVRS